MPTPHARRVDELDLLRFVAALAVVFFHYAFRGHAADGLSALPYPLLAPLARYGYLGVALFFLISGFVILMSASGGSLRDFAVSRTVRLYPAFWVCCTLTFAVVALSGGRGVGIGNYLANLTLLGGFVGIPAVDGVYWSLFVELKFYALVALMLALNQLHRAERLLQLWLLAVLALTLVPVGIVRALLIADYAPYFVGGAMCYLIRAHGLSAPRLATLLAAWLLALHAASAELAEIEAHYHSAFDIKVVMTLVSGFFVAMVLVAVGHTGPFAGRRWLTLGALTYPLYLLHQNIGYAIFNAAYASLNVHLLFWGTVALMLAAAHGVNVLVERRLAAVLKKSLHAALDIGGGGRWSRARP